MVIGLSGGVDSSVAAWLLKKQGYDVTGIFMKNWHDTTGLIQSDCHWEDDLMFAGMVAKKIGIPFHMVDLSEQYRKKVVDYMFSEYEKGRTPNPDILCNKEIKFDSFVEEAKKLGIGLVATGHYCRKATTGSENKIIHRLLTGNDPDKDQSYFLCQLSQEQLSAAVFPIGEMLKSEVRSTAEDIGLATARRKDSQGICFVGKVNLPVFLQQKLKTRKGNIIEIRHDQFFKIWEEGMPGNETQDEELAKACEPYRFHREDGRIIGEHEGAHFFTIGQRKGLNIGGYSEPLFVIGTDIHNNIIYVGEGQSHPGLHRKGLFIRNDEVHWIRRDMRMVFGEYGDYLVRIRYRQPLQKARLYCRKNGVYIIFNSMQRGITPGQFAAWYRDDEVIGSGVIS